MRRLLTLVSAVVLVDTSFYAAITPLLPYYAEHEHLTRERNILVIDIVGKVREASCKKVT